MGLFGGGGGLGGIVSSVTGGIGASTVLGGLGDLVGDAASKPIQTLALGPMSLGLGSAVDAFDELSGQNDIDTAKRKQRQILRLQQQQRDVARQRQIRQLSNQQARANANRAVALAAQGISGASIGQAASASLTSQLGTSINQADIDSEIASTINWWQASLNQSQQAAANQQQAFGQVLSIGGQAIGAAFGGGVF